MGMHNKLPIYTATRDLLKATVQITRNFPRDIKQSMGVTLLKETSEMVVLILRANIAVNASKVPHLDELLERLQVVELLFRVLTDLRFLTPQKHGEIIGLMSSIGKQAQGWKKHSSQ